MSDHLRRCYAGEKEFRTVGTGGGEADMFRVSRLRHGDDVVVALDSADAPALGLPLSRVQAEGLRDWLSGYLAATATEGAEPR